MRSVPACAYGAFRGPCCTRSARDGNAYSRLGPPIILLVVAEGGPRESVGEDAGGEGEGLGEPDGRYSCVGARYT